MTNLPPGVSANDIPGNTPEEEAWEKVHFDIDTDCEEQGLDDMDAAVAWRMGLELYLHLRHTGVRFPHDPTEPDQQETR